ncbi:hypothetical protein AnigIFM63326_006399 [Aspergillus niger]|nr:hypothetical protein AnigIFM63326_006399 [Aspergillus niger]
MSPWEKNGGKIQQEVDELWRIFMAVTTDPSSRKTICVLDALDECRTDDQQRLIQRLNKFHEQSVSLTQESWLKFLVTSRPYNEIQIGFRTITDNFPQTHLKGELENDQIHKEINLVIKVKMKQLAEESMLPSDIRKRIENQLLQMKHRTYLWLYLAIDDIRTTFRDSLRPADISIQKIIQEIPHSVSAAYEKILSRVPSREVDTPKNGSKLQKIFSKNPHNGGTL